MDLIGADGKCAFILGHDSKRIKRSLYTFSFLFFLFFINLKTSKCPPSISV